jgi:hypothetical protein
MMIIVLVLLLLAYVSYALVREVRADGLGRRPAPRSHLDPFPLGCRCGGGRSARADR